MNELGRQTTKEALLTAIKRGDIAEVERLLDRVADVSGRGHNDWTPLHLACLHGHTDIATLLLDRGADVGARNGYSRSLLHEACRMGHTDTARMLLDRGADVNAVDKYSYTPLHVACRWGRANVIDITRLLIERGADVGAQGEDGRTPLDVAIDLEEDDPDREPLLEVFQELAPEAYFTKFCETQGRASGRGM